MCIFIVFLKVPEFIPNTIRGVTPVLDRSRLRDLQHRCEEACGWTRGGFPGSQPISMDKTNMLNLRLKPYMVSWKADGTRYMMLIDGENRVFMFDRDNNVFHVSGLRFPRRKNPGEHVANTLVDGVCVMWMIVEVRIDKC